MFLRPLALTCAVLSIPLVAMGFTSEVSWGVFDFILMGGLIFMFALSYEVLAKKFRTLHPKLLIAAALLTCLILIWIELAVGILS